MDFMDKVLDHLESNLTLFSTFKVDILSDDANALTIRRTPSSPSSRFFDDTRVDEFMFQILVKNTSQRIALETINNIVVELEDLKFIYAETDSFELLKCEVYTLPLFVEEDSRGSYIYTALFKATLVIKGR